jgi:hypothetical protein
MTKAIGRDVLDQKTKACQQTCGHSCGKIAAHPISLSDIAGRLAETTSGALAESGWWDRAGLPSVPLAKVGQDLDWNS